MRKLLKQFRLEKFYIGFMVLSVILAIIFNSVLSMMSEDYVFYIKIAAAPFCAIFFGLNVYLVWYFGKMVKFLLGALEIITGPKIKIMTGIAIFTVFIVLQ